jgi:hypothetical protein
VETTKMTQNPSTDATERPSSGGKLPRELPQNPTQVFDTLEDYQNQPPTLESLAAAIADILDRMDADDEAYRELRDRVERLERQHPLVDPANITPTPEASEREVERAPHREICALCHEVSRVSYHVPDEVWEAAVHWSHRQSLICLRCFTRQADARRVDWSRGIRFAPTSLVQHDRWVSGAEPWPDMVPMTGPPQPEPRPIVAEAATLRARIRTPTEGGTDDA